MKGNKTLRNFIIAVIAYVLICSIGVATFFATRTAKENTKLAQTEQVEMSSVTLAEREKLRAMTYSRVTDSNYSTGVDQVKFAAFFLRDLDEDGYAEQYAGTCKQVNEKDTLYVEFKVLTSGYLENGQITISNSNFKWNTAIVSDTIVDGDYIGNTSTIRLKSTVNNGSQKLLMGTISNNIGNNINNYSKQVDITLTGTYVSETGDRTEINTTKKVTVDWYGEVEASIPTTQTTKYMSDLSIDENYVSITAPISTKEVKGELLLSNNYTRLKIPKLNGYEPVGVSLVNTSNASGSRGTVNGEDIFTINRNATVNSGYVSNKISQINYYTVKITYPRAALNADEDFSLQIPIETDFTGYNNTNSEFSSLRKSNIAKDIMVINIKKETPGFVYRFDTTIGEKIPYHYIGETYVAPTYIISKEKPLQIYNRTVADTEDDNYTVIWTFERGNSGEVKKAVMKETANKTDEFLNTSGTYSSMLRYAKNIGIYFSGATAMLGENGYIKVYNDETNQLINTFTAENWGNYTKSNPYRYPSPVNHIRVETSEAAKETELLVFNVKEIDDSVLTSEINKATFDNLTNVYTYLTGSVQLTNNGSLTSTNRTAAADYTIGKSYASLKLSKEMISTHKTENDFVLTIETLGSMSTGETPWKNGQFLIKVPNEIAAINYKTSSVYDSYGYTYVMSGEIVTINGERFIKIITTTQDDNAFARINIICDITPNPTSVTMTRNFELYAYNENTSIYAVSHADTYDVNDNNNKTEIIGYCSTPLSLVAPSNLVTSEHVSNYDSNNSITVAPNVAEVSTSQRTATINVNMVNSYAGTISDVKVVGVIPFANNRFVLTGGQLDSNFSTVMKNTGIQVPNELQNKVVIYYSDVEHPTKDLKDANNKWVRTPSDWTKVKSYLIDFQDYSIPQNASYSFSYNVTLPELILNNMKYVSYSAHAIYYTLDTDQGKFLTNVEPNKVGITIVRKYDFELTKVKYNTTRVVPGATYGVYDYSTGKLKTAKTDSNGKLVFKDLCVGIPYQLYEVKAPKDYDLAQGVESFIVNEDISRNLSCSNSNEYGLFVQNVSLSNGKLIGKTYDLPKVNVKIKKQSTTGQNLSNVVYGLLNNGKLYTTNADGEFTIEGLSINTQYYLTEVRANGYYVDTTQKSFMIQWSGTNYQISSNDSAIQAATITDNGNQDPVMVQGITFVDEKIPTFNLQLQKIENTSSSTVKPLANAYFELISLDGQESRVLASDANGMITINDLYAYVSGKSQIKGEYTLQEIKAPDGYTNNAEYIKFKVTYNTSDSTYSIRIINDYEVTSVKSATVQGNVIKMVVTDTPLFKLIKKDDSGNRVPNVKVAIYALDQAGNKVGFAKGVDGNYVGEKGTVDGKEYYYVTTDSNGEVSLALPGGNYRAVEIEGPAGYEITDGSKAFSIDGIEIGEELDNAITVSAIEDLVQISKNVNDGTDDYLGKTIVLSKTLDFNNTASYRNANTTSFGDINGNGTVEGLKTELTTGKGFAPIGRTKTFKGIFDGKGYEINNLYIDGTTQTEPSYRGDSSLGLFGYTSGATIKNLGVSGSVTGYNYIGGIVGMGTNTSIINCHSSATINGCQRIGGIAGYSYSGKLTINQCYFTGSVIIGQLDHFYGYAAGGILGQGYSDSEVKNCYSTGTVTNAASTPSGTGGIVGICEGKIYNCYDMGDIHNAHGTITSYYRGDRMGNCFTVDGVIIERATNSSDGYDGQTVSYGYMLTDEFYNKLNVDGVWTKKHGQPPVLNNNVSTIEGTQVEIINKKQEYTITTEVAKNSTGTRTGGTITGTSIPNVTDSYGVKFVDEVPAGGSSTKTIKATASGANKIRSITVNNVEILDQTVTPPTSVTIPSSVVTNVTEDKHIVVLFEENVTQLGKVTVHHYLQGTTQKLADDEVYTGDIGANYTTAPRMDIENYELVKVNGNYQIPSNASGTYKSTPQEVIYYYNKADVTLTVRHIKAGTTIELAEAEVTTQKAGTTYTTAPSSTLLNTYDVVGVIGDTTGTLIEDTEVDYLYAIKGVYTVKYTKGDHGTFTTQTKSNLDYGTLTPTFTGEKKGEAGYTFIGWIEEGTTNIVQDEDIATKQVTKNTTYVAQWQPNTNTQYTVEYYYEVDNSYPEVPNADSVVRRGTTGTIVSVTQDDMTPKRENYIFDSVMINDLTGTVKGDGTLVLKVYFKKAYTITYTKGTKGTFPTQSTNDNYYGNQTPTFVGQKTGEVGYTFIGWKKENTGSILSDANIAATTVTGNATYVAQWQANTNTQYKIQFYYQNNGAYSTTPNASQNRTGTTDTTASATTADKTPNNSIAPAPTNNKYVLDTAAPNVLSGNIAGNGSLVLKVYFKPQYTVIYKPGTKGTFTEQKTENIDHGSNTPAFTGTTTGKPGYDFTGWSPTIVSTVTANATYVAQWRARTDTKYKVQYYYEENGSYPTTPNGDRLATDGIKETIRQGTTDTTANVTTADKTPKNNVSNYKYDTTAANVVSGNIEGDGSLVLKVYFKEIPVNYNVDVILTDTKGTELNQNKFNILKQQGTGSKTQVWNNNTVTNSAEVQERRIKIDNYTYEIRELEAPNKNYVNVLEGKYIKVSTAVAQDGTVSISDWKVYNSSNDSLVATTDPVYQKVSVTLKSPTSGFKTIEVKVINPVTFTVEVEKVDTDGNKLADTGIEIKSEIIDEQNAVHKDEVEKEAVTNMTNTGLVTGTTNDQGIVKYDETWVDANSATTGFYTYVIKETQTAGAQYVNILQGYEIVVRVHVEPDGTLTLVNKNGQRYNANDIKYAIRPVNGAELPTTNDLYKYVKVEIENNSINALIDHTGRLEVDVTNPVRYNVNLNVKDTKNQNLAGTNFKVNRANTQVFSGEPGTQVEIAEGPMNAGTYTYYITENSAPNAKYVNVLSGKYIKLVLKVDGNGVVSILDANQNINSDYYEVYSGNINDVNKSSHTRVTDNNVLKYISVNPSNSNGLYTINANIINPVKYQVDIITRDTSNNFLTGTNVVAYRDTVKLYDNDATEQKEITEDIMDANQYVYYFTQTGKKDENYVNVLEGKYIKAVVTLNPNGTLVLNSTELYQGRIGDAGATKVTTGSVLNYFNVSIVQGELDTLQVIIKNPVEFKFEVDTVDSGDTKDEDGKPIKSPLGNTGIEISSPIIDAQNKEHNNEIISGVTSITNDGKVKGTTTDYVDNGVKARVSYEETWVNAGTYTYEIRETKTAGNQYVNILNGYKVVVRVKVDADGRLTLVNRSGTAYASDVQDKFEIVADDGSEVPEDIYTYVDVVVNNGKVKAILNAQIENPVRYNVAIHETVYGKEQIPLAGMPVEVSGFTPKTTLVTGNNGSVQIEESPVRADTYKYMITQLDAVNGVAVEDEFVNILDGYYIGVDLRVHSNGVIKTVNSNGDETTVDYKLYKRNEQGELQEISFNDTIVDDFVKVKITEGEGEENENVYTLNVYIQIPEKFNLKLIKSDVDTAERLNNVEFSIVAKDSAGEISLKDTTTGKDAKTAFETIDTSKLFTANVNDEDGIIEVNNILIEKAGTYRFYISETTPEVEGLIYKDKSEPVVAQVEIDVENGKYVVKGLQIVQASRYTLLDECSITGDETKTVNVSIINERIKGSYDLITKTLNKFTDELIDGGIYKITVKNEEGEELVLYVSDDNVLSQNLVLPYEGDVNGDIEGTSVLPIEDVRIELPGTYTILIQELKSTENFTDLDDIIEFTVTTARKGEFDNEEYVVEKTELKEANHGLVTVTNTDHQIDVVVRKEYFDLALRQYITKVNEKEFEDRIPTVELEAFNRNESTTAVYNQKKQPQRAYAGNEVIYTIEVFNEGLIDGYAQEITEYLPEGLEFVDDEFNKEQGWKYDAESNKVVTRKLAKENEGVIENSADKAIDNIMGEATEESAGNLIKAYNKATSKMDSRKVQLKLKVSEDIKLKSKLTTIAEITEVLAEDRKQTLERDSKQFVNVPEGEELANYKDDLVELPYIAGDEDDDDFEKLLIEEFDLATVKYITKVNDKEVEGESIELSLADEKADEYKEGVFTGFKYKVNREIEKVKQNDKVTYSIRVYNEGTVPAYADEVIDIIPKDLAFDPESEINKKYGWVMMDENNEVTTDISKARYVSTNYLSKATQDDKNAKIEEAIAKGEEPNVEIDSIVIPDTIDIPVKESEGDEESKATEEGTEPAGDEGEVTEEGTEPTENEGEGTEEGTEPEGDEGEGTEEGTEPTGDEGEGTEEGTEPTGDEGEGTEEETEPAGDEGEATENGDNSEEESLVEEEKTSRVNNLMLAKVVENGKVTIDYRQLEIEFTVKEPISEDRTITNVALTPTYNDDLEIGVTDIEPIEVLKEHIEKIYVKSFDLSLKQEINKIIVTAANGETIGEFSLENGDDISKLAKVDIPKNKLEGSEVRVEYKITVTNEGETSGYVSEITDHIPEGFIFRLEDNPDWSCADGVYTYNALEDVLLNPEESKEITIVLIWNNIANIGNKANLVEITKHLDENKLEVVDIDSTPGNLVLTEDDIDLTTVIIAVKTGQIRTVAMILSALCFIIAIGSTIVYMRNERKNKEDDVEETHE